MKKLISAFVAAAATLPSGCAKAPPPNDQEFKLVADSLGDVPLHPDALKLDNLALAYDGSMETRWTSVGNMEPGFFVELDFPRGREVSSIVLDTSPSPNDFPREFVVEVADDDGEWEEVFVGGPAATKKGVTTIPLNPPRRAKRVLITLNKEAPFWWSIYEIKVNYAR